MGGNNTKRTIKIVVPEYLENNITIPQLYKSAAIELAIDLVPMIKYEIDDVERGLKTHSFSLDIISKEEHDLICSEYEDDLFNLGKENKELKRELSQIKQLLRKFNELLRNS